MDLFGRITFFIFLTIAFCDAENLGEQLSLFPAGNTWKYNYKAKIKTGALEPQHAYSQWELNSVITVVGGGNISYIQLSDVSVKLYNGPADSVPDVKSQSIEKIEQLTQPFSVYYVDGLIANIGLEFDEPPWIKNLKRGIASILQLDLKHLTPAAFYSAENTIFGACIVEYNILKDANSNSVKVSKSIDHKQCQNYPAHVWSSAPIFICPYNHKEQIIMNSERHYALEVENNVILIKDISANGGVYVQPFEALGDAYFSVTSQTLQWKEITAAAIVPENAQKLQLHTLTFEINTFDYTFGREKITQNKRISDILNDLESLTTSFDDNDLIKNPKNVHNKISEKLFFNMKNLDLDSLKQIYAEIGIGTSYQLETKTNIFLELLPQIGSEASAIFIKELIASKKMKDITAIKLLSTFPFYMEFPSENLLTIYEQLLDSNIDIPFNVKKSAILSFATLTFRTLANKKCTLETFEKYVKKYFDAFSESKDFELKMLYLEGLSNLQLGSVVQYLTPVIMKGSEHSLHLRFLAVWASMDLAPLTPTTIFQTYWPILEDRTEHLEMRVAAFTMLFISQPTPARLLSLYWFMQTEKDEHLYNFYYTTIHSLQFTTFPCYKHLGSLASQIVRFIRPPNSKRFWVTGNYLVDYADSNRGFGSMLQLFLVGNPKTDRLNVFYLTVNNYAAGRVLGQFAIFLKLRGVSESVLSKLMKISADSVKIDELINILKEAKVDLKPAEPVHIEIIAQTERKTVYCAHINETTFNKLAKVAMELHNFQLEYHVNYQHVGIAVASRGIMASDVGTPVILGGLSGAVASLRGNFTHHLANSELTRRNDLDFRYSFQAQHSLRSYNPLLNVFQGTERKKIIYGTLPIINNVSLDVSNWSLHVTFKKNIDGPSSGTVLHTEAVTFVRRDSGDPKELLKKSCANCESEHVLRKNVNQKNKDIINVGWEDIARKLKISLFECDKGYDIKKMFSDIAVSHHANDKIFPAIQPILYLQHTLDYVSFISPEGSCGLVTILDSYDDQPSLLDAVIRLNYESLKSTKHSISGDKIKLTFKLTHSNDYGEPNLQTLDAVFLLERSNGHIEHAITIEVDRRTEKIRQKFCAHGQTKLPQWKPDLFSVEPLGPTHISGDIAWGIYTDLKESTCPRDQTKIGFNITAEITQEQIDLANAAAVWPFKQCKEKSASHKFTPLEEECYRASLEVSTPRKYTASVSFDKVPSELIIFNKRLKALVELFHTPTAKNLDVLDLASGSESVIEVSALQNTAVLTVNGNSIHIDIPDFIDISHFLINSRFPTISELGVSLGLINSCVVTSSHVTNINNETVPIEKEKKLVAIADCSTQPKFALFVTSVATGLAFSFYTGGNSVSVSYSGQNVTIQVNQQIVDAKQGYQFPLDEDLYDFKVWHLEKDVIEIDSKLSKVWLHATTEYILVMTPGFYRGHVCGVCSP